MYMKSKSQKLVTAFVIVVASFNLTSHVYAGTEQNAVEMLRETGVTKNFPMMCLQTAVMTQTYAIMVSSIGKEKTMQILINETKAITPKYQEQWDKNMAKAWAPYLSDEEMISIKLEKQKSPYATKFMAQQDKVGPVMQSLSKDLLTSTTSEIITSSFKKSVP